eukprot:TRINITY_DN18521_c0_g1_i1.p1 TRINITY_DN18521_c0_g1~~TRINITY_DN18521_c0_g1_i1.p1  ORF type:complete len:1407 (+),score=628.12 TRINITY_DN18521_c0_g1_i1:629-4222(+)
MAFSKDNKYLVTATGMPDGFLVVWLLDKTCKPLWFQEIASPVTCVTISPWSSATVCTTGPSTLRLFKYAPPNPLKVVDPVGKRRDYTYTCHAWFEDEGIVASTMEGDVVVIQNGEVKRIIASALPNGHPVHCVVVVSRGFLCAGEDGQMGLFERTYDANLYNPYRAFRTPEGTPITFMSVAPNEETVVLSCSDNTASVFHIANIDIVEPAKGGGAVTGGNAVSGGSVSGAAPSTPTADGAGKTISAGGGDVESVFKQISIGFHSNVITSVSVCIQRPFVVTSSTDHHVRIWNYLRRRTEIDTEFDEDVEAVACHPNGLRLVIAFKYKMRMYSILSRSLHPVHEFPVKSCKEVAFAAGGQHFAASVVTKVFLYDAYTFACLGFLAGHASMVRSISWAMSDQVLITSGYEGAIYFWHVETCKRIAKKDIMIKAVAHSAVRFDEDAQLVVAVGANKIADLGLPEGMTAARTFSTAQHEEKQAKEKEKNTVLPLAKPIPLGLARTQQTNHSRTMSVECCISFSHKCLFLGNTNGQILVYPWPVKEGDQPILTVDAHNAAVSYVVLSHDESFLFTVGDDRSLFVFEVDSKARTAADRRVKAFNHTTFEEVNYVLQHDLEEQHRRIDELVAVNEDLERAQQGELAKMRERMAKVVEQKQRDTVRQLHEHEDRMAYAKAERNTVEAQAQEKGRASEILHLKAAEDLESLYTAKTAAMESAYKALLDEKEDVVVQYENKISSIRKDWEAAKQKMKEDSLDYEAAHKREVAMLVKEKEAQAALGDEKLRLLEEEYEQEIHDCKDYYKRERSLKDEQCEKDALEARSRQQTQEKNDLAIEKLNRELANRNELVARSKVKNKEQEKANDALRLEIDVRIDTITTSEKKMLELKKQTAELDKLRCVLAFKFNELRKEVSPKEEQIRVMHERMKDMEAELEKITNDSDSITRALRAKYEKIQVIKRDVEHSKSLLEGKDILIKGLLRKVAHIASTCEGRAAVYALRDAVEQFITKQDASGQSNSKVIHEFHRQRAYIEKQLSSMAKQTNRREINLSQDNQRKTAENSLLVKEINELRHEKKAVLQTVYTLEGAVQEMQAKLADKTRGTHAGGTGGKSPVPSGAPPIPRPSTAFSKPGASLVSLAKMDAESVAEIIHKVESNNLEMARQQQDLKRLKEFVAHLLSRAKLETAPTQEEVGMYQQIHRDVLGD